MRASAGSDRSPSRGTVMTLHATSLACQTCTLAMIDDETDVEFLG